MPGSRTLIEHFNGTAWSIVPSPSPGSIAILGGVTTSNAANNVWAVGADTPAGTSGRQTLTLNWNGTAWNVVASPSPGSTGGVGAVAANLAFGKAVYDQRRALGFGVADLAERAGMSADEIECIEEGGTEPTIALLRRLAAALDADVHLTAGHDLGSVWFEPHAA